MRFRWHGALVILVIASLGMMRAAHADFHLLKSMVSPGDVIAGHAKFEQDCSLCHKRFSKSGQDQLCMACHAHEDIAADVRLGRGFHGRNRNKPCKACHTEHKGRKAKIVQLDPGHFDHRMTDFPLRGKHAVPRRKCAACHKPGHKFRDAPQRCVGCHRSDDRHHGSLGDACEQCHSDRGWKIVHFDHAKTDFPLRGAHARVRCRSCHKRNMAEKKLPTLCYGCHRSDDRHHGTLGKDCDRCHTERTWKVLSFDHNRTRFPLLGAHGLLRCKTCHLTNLRRLKPPMSCAGCHMADDVHKGQEGKQCGDCHNEKTWKHALFDHGLTRFPLLGRHAHLKCKACHRSARFKDASIRCVSCHRKDDDHKRRLGPDCGLCHDARSWKRWSFDHNRQTSFVLDGAHRNLICISCHKRPTSGRPTLPGTCNDCHAKDDVHQGEFGTYCERCHVTSRFSTIRNLPSLAP